MTQNRSTAVTANLNGTDEDLIRQVRYCGDPLVEDLCRRLADARDDVERADMRLVERYAMVAEPSDFDLTGDQCDQIADAILKAAGSGLRHYTLPKSRSDIRAAVRASVGEVVNGDEL